MSRVGYADTAFHARRYLQVGVVERAEHTKWLFREVVEAPAPAAHSMAASTLADRNSEEADAHGA